MKSKPVCSLTLQEHASLFCQHKELMSEYIYVSGMSNYYGDTAFLNDEVEALMNELEAMSETLRDEKARALVLKLTCIAKKAVQENSGIFCFGG